MPFDLSDYVTVAERIAQFRKLHPEGSLQSGILKEPSEDFPYIIVVAQAYRTPDDPRPGVGMAQESFPGKTPYTRDSETQNAETSAWGRAIVAALAADTKVGIATKEDVEKASGGDGLAGASAPDGNGGGGAEASGEGATVPPSSTQKTLEVDPSYVAQLKQDVLAKYGSISRAREAEGSGRPWGDFTAIELEQLL